MHLLQITKALMDDDESRTTLNDTCVRGDTKGRKDNLVLIILGAVSCVVFVTVFAVATTIMFLLRHRPSQGR